MPASSLLSSIIALNHSRTVNVFYHLTHQIGHKADGANAAIIPHPNRSYHTKESADPITGAVTGEHDADVAQLVETTVAIAQVEQLLNRLLALNLPISWENTPLTVDCFTSDGDSRLLCDNTRNLWLLSPSNNPDWLGFILRKLIGIAITSLAIAQGAPFWFDLLNRLVRGRSSSSSS